MMLIIPALFLGLHACKGELVPASCSAAPNDAGGEHHCLLANSFEKRAVMRAGGDFVLDDSLDTQSSEEMPILHERPALIELNSQSSARQRATQQAMWVSFRGTLGHTLAELEDSRASANGALGDLIDKFIAKQSGTDDACHAQLLEAKDQLNQLHQHVNDLALAVNTTDQQVQVLNAQVKAKLKEIEDLNKWCKDEFQKIEDTQAKNLQMLATLRDELKELKQMANPNVTMNLTEGKVFGGLQLDSGVPDIPDNTLSLIQMDVPEDDVGRVRAHSNVFVSLQLALKSVQQCMSLWEPHSHTHWNKVHPEADLSLLSSAKFEKQIQNATTTTTTVAE